MALSTSISKTILSTAIVANGEYILEHHVKTHSVPNNLRLFHYNINLGYDIYYLLKLYKDPKKSYNLYFINKQTGKIYKKEFHYKEYSPNEKLPKDIILGFNNIKHIMGVGSSIINPDGSEQTFNQYGNKDPFTVSLSDLLEQLSAHYKKEYPNHIIEVHLMSHTKGGKSKEISPQKYYIEESPDLLSQEEKKHTETTLLNNFIVVKDYSQCKYIANMIKKNKGKESDTTIIKKAKTFISKMRTTDHNFHTFVERSKSNRNRNRNHNHNSKRNKSRRIGKN